MSYDDTEALQKLVDSKKDKPKKKRKPRSDAGKPRPNYGKKKKD